MSKTCKSCGRGVYWLADENEYFYRDDIMFCSLCCLEENECNCIDIRNIQVDKIFKK